MSPSTFQLTIIDPQQTLFQGEVTALTTFNDQGRFDILAQHINLISLIKQKIIVHLPDRSQKPFPVTRGVLRCVENRVDIYLGV